MALNVTVVGRGTIGKAIIKAATTAGHHMNETPADLLVFSQGIPPTADGSALTDMMDAHVAPILRVVDTYPQRPGALVVLFSSVAVKKGSHDLAYSAAKGAVEALVPALARKYRRQRFVAVAPGLVEGSPVATAMEEEHQGEHRKRMFQQQLVQPSDIAKLVLTIAEIPSIHNTVIAIDGGYRL